MLYTHISQFVLKGFGSICDLGRKCGFPLTFGTLVILGCQHGDMFYSFVFFFFLTHVTNSTVFFSTLDCCTIFFKAVHITTFMRRLPNMGSCKRYCFGSSFTENHRSKAVRNQIQPESISKRVTWVRKSPSVKLMDTLHDHFRDVLQMAAAGTVSIWPCNHSVRSTLFWHMENQMLILSGLRVWDHLSSADTCTFNELH